MHRNRFLIASIICLALVLLCAAGLSGATYYIKTGGNDTAAGTSDGTAWATYGKVRTVIAAGVMAGDQFLFNRGDTFVPGMGGGWLSIGINAKNGNSGAYCVIGAYGTGDKPIIEQRYTVTGAWTDDGGNKWHNHLAWAVNNVQRCFVDGVESVEAANAGAINGTDHLWYYNAGILYLYSTADPAGKTVKVCVDSGSIGITNSNYWKFENIEWRGAYLAFELGATACSYLEWNGCEFNYGSYAQIMNYNNLAGDGHHHLTINGCTFDGKGALISKAVTETELEDTWKSNLIQFDKSINYVTIIDSIFRDGLHCHLAINANGASGNGINYVTVSGCSFYGDNAPYIRPFGIGGPAGKCTNISFVRNYINNVNVRAQLGGSGNVVAYNIWDTVRVKEETAAEARSNALCLYSTVNDVCTNNVIANNTFHNIDMEGVWINKQVDDTTTGNSITNNILWNCGQRGTNMDAYLVGAAVTIDSGISDTNHFHNNCIYNDAEVHVITHEGTQYTVAEAEAAEATVYSDNIQTDPLCISTSDFHLKGISPCLDVGFDVGLTIDYLGNPVPWGNIIRSIINPIKEVIKQAKKTDDKPDIGVYEFYW